MAFTENNHWIATYDLGGTVSSVSFVGDYNTGGKKASVLRLYGTTGSTNREDWVEIASWTAGEISGEKTVAVPVASGFRRLVWQYTKDGGNAYLGSVVIEGSGFSTPKFLSDWGPAPVSQGLVQSCTITPTRAGRTNWVEVSVTDGAKTCSTVEEIVVPDANPVTLLILK